MGAMSPMEPLGEATWKGQQLYVADDGFAQPGLYAWDPERRENVCLVSFDRKPAMRLRAGVAEIARVCHEANRVLQKILGEEQNPPWDECSDEMKLSAIEGVQHALNGDTPEKLHEKWMEFKQLHGWRYGEAKDEEKKTHPCLLPYEDLPEEQKTKDHLFHSIVRSMVTYG